MVREVRSRRRATRIAKWLFLVVEICGSRCTIIKLSPLHAEADRLHVSRRAFFDSLLLPTTSSCIKTGQVFPNFLKENWSDFISKVCE